jgi:O-acetyl-ADP-ribose deacetylase (regulator of RNase III)
MNEITYVRGSLFKTKREIIAHSVNTIGLFGAGVAKQIATFYPKAKESYLKSFNRGDWSLGKVQFVKCDDKIIANMATQNNVSKGDVQNTDYEACYEAFKKLLKYAKENGLGVALPKIGSGLGGGDWNEVEKQLLKAMAIYEVEVDVHYL